jgi:hypothetical protein
LWSNTKFPIAVNQRTLKLEYRALTLKTKAPIRKKEAKPKISHKMKILKVLTLRRNHNMAKANPK